MTESPDYRIEPPGKKILDMRTSARAEHLKQIRAAIQQATGTAGCGEQCTEDIVIAVNEACMNVIQHGYKQDPDGVFIIQLSVDGGDVIVWIADYCAPVDPDGFGSRDLKDIRPGGLGVHFMSECMDNVTFLDPPADLGNLLQMTKRIS